MSWHCGGSCERRECITAKSNERIKTTVTAAATPSFLPLQHQSTHAHLHAKVKFLPAERNVYQYTPHYTPSSSEMQEIRHIQNWPTVDNDIASTDIQQMQHQKNTLQENAQLWKRDGATLLYYFRMLLNTKTTISCPNCSHTYTLLWYTLYQKFFFLSVVTLTDI